MKQRWAILKNQGSQESDKMSAKKRINEIQVTLKLDKTDFTKPYTPKTQTTQTTVDAQVAPKTTQRFTNELNEFMDTALPIAIANATKYAPDDDARGQLIVAQAFLKPLGTVYASLINNAGR